MIPLGKVRLMGGTLGVGGMFALQLRFTDDYPSSPPIVRFLTQVFHPNGRNLPPLQAQCFWMG